MVIAACDADRLDGDAVIAQSASICIEAPAPFVWARLAKLEDIKLWSEAVVDARCEGDRSRGVGAERRCLLKGGVRIREFWLEWDEGRSFTYEGLGVPFVTRAMNRWTVHGEGHRTLLASEARLTLKAGWLGRLLRGDRIAGITGFPHDLELFERLGAPLVLPSTADECPAGGS